MAPLPRHRWEACSVEHIRGLLAEQGRPAQEAVLALFSLQGFHPDLERAAAGRSDVLLVDLPALYGDGPLRGLG